MKFHPQQHPPHGGGHVAWTLALLLILLTFYLSSPVPHSSSSKKRGVASQLNPQKRNRLTSPFQYNKLSINYKSLRQHHAAFAKANPNEQLDETTQVFPQGTPLSVTIDRVCANSVQISAQLDIDSFSYQLVDRRLNRAGLGVQAYSVALDRDASFLELYDRVENDPCVVGVSEEGVAAAGSLYSDPRVADQIHLVNIKAQETEDFYHNSSLQLESPVHIAIVDTGVDYNHIDLVNQMWVDSQGSHGFDFVNSDTDPFDDNLHGTHVAGLAAAAGANDVAGSGVMPANIKIMAVKVLNASGSGSFTDISNGIRWAADNGADIMNLSLSGSGANAGILDALVYAVNKGVTIFVSAGNDGHELNETTTFRTPASYGFQIEGVVTVGSINATESTRSFFSNFSTQQVEIAAPGSGGIFSTLPSNQFGSLSGTSMSTPIAAGAGALAVAILKSAGVSYTAADVERIVTHSARQNPDLNDFFVSGRQLSLTRMQTFLLNNHVTPLDGGLSD